MYDLFKYEGYSWRLRFVVSFDEFFFYGVGDFECGVKIRGVGVFVRLC